MDTATKSRLLNIPTEVRCVILEYLLASSLDEFTICNRSNVKGGPPFVVYEGSVHPAIIRTCKMMRDEGTAVLYSSTAFRFNLQRTDGLPNFVKYIGLENASRLRDLRFTVSSAALYRAMGAIDYMAVEIDNFSSLASIEFSAKSWFFHNNPDAPASARQTIAEHIAQQLEKNAEAMNRIGSEVEQVLGGTLKDVSVFRKKIEHEVAGAIQTITSDCVRAVVMRPR